MALHSRRQLELQGRPDRAARRDREPAANTKAIILDGSNFEYYFAGHTLSGTLNEVRLSTLGASYNSDGSFTIVNGHIANVSTAVEISGLSICNAQNVRGDFHSVPTG